MIALFEGRFNPQLKEGLEDLYNLYIYIDGRFVKGEEAKISVFDHGFLYGDGVFEGIRVYDGLIFKLDEHLDRLYNSAKAIGLEAPLIEKEMKEVILRVLRMNQLRDAHIRPIITRGFGKPGFDPRRSVRPTVVVMAYPFKPHMGLKPLRLITSSVRKRPPQVLDSKIKSLNYLNHILGKLQANAFGADDAIMLDMNGYISELCTANIFLVKGEKLYTPYPTSCLRGITRDTIIEIAEELGYGVEERNITLQELYTADEAFACGTGAEIVPCAEVDGRRIGIGDMGPITRRIREVYMGMVRDKASPYTTSVYD